MSDPGKPGGWAGTTSASAAVAAAATTAASPASSSSHRSAPQLKPPPRPPEVSPRKLSPQQKKKPSSVGEVGWSPKKRLIDNSPFPVKLHSILSDSKWSNSITWLPHGKAWKIVNIALFEVEVLPRFFRSNKYQSFMRQVSFDLSKLFVAPSVQMFRLCCIVHINDALTST